MVTSAFGVGVHIGVWPETGTETTDVCGPRWLRSVKPRTFNELHVKYTLRYTGCTTLHSHVLWTGLVHKVSMST